MARQSPRRALAMLLLALWIFAASTEIGQSYIDREPSLADWGADMAGAVVGLFAGSVLLRLLLGGELLEAVRRAAVMAQRNTPLRLRFSEGELTISAQSQDVGETRESLAVGYAGEPLEIGFNAEFLREGLESVTADDIQLKLINPLRPGLLSADGDAFWYLIMPIRLAG